MMVLHAFLFVLFCVLLLVCVSERCRTSCIPLQLCLVCLLLVSFIVLLCMDLLCCAAALQSCCVFRVHVYSRRASARRDTHEWCAFDVCRQVCCCCLRALCLARYAQHRRKRPSHRAKASGSVLDVL
jgi:hypothetical protein